MAASPALGSSPTSRAASAVELAARSSTPGSVPARKRWHCAVATGIDSTALTSSSVVPRPGQQAVLDVEHDLALDQQVVVEGQRVLR